jgi:pyroglutamyl-peptidase
MSQNLPGNGKALRANKTLLVTGFNRFGNLRLNPTELMMTELERFENAWEDCRLVTEVLPTEYKAAEKRIRLLISRWDPDAIVAFGVAPAAKDFHLERFALNLDDATVPDNSGWIPDGVPIVRGGPPCYESTLPLSDILSALQHVGIPAKYSNHAGTYVCNHVFYTALHEVDSFRRNALCGFIHVPFAFEGVNSSAADEGSLSEVLNGVKLCLHTVRQHLARRVSHRQRIVQHGLARRRGI